MSTIPEQPPTGPILDIPDFCIVALVGASGCGKSTFAAKHFLPSEILSSDAFRAWVSDDEGSLDATDDAFDALHHIARLRLKRRRLVVIDATNVQQHARKEILKLADEYDTMAVAVILNVPERVCQDRNKDRPNRDFGPHVVRNQSRALKDTLRSIRREGFRHIYVLDNQEQIDHCRFERRPLWTDRRGDHGPFDIIGDIHGCHDELVELLGKLGYQQTESGWTPPEGRRAIFLGDLVDRGPGVVEAVRLVMGMVKAGTALCVPGNHDVKLMRALSGRNVKVAHGLQESLDQIEALPEEEREAFKREYVQFADSMVSHFVLEEGRLVVAHAGMKEAYQGRASRRVRDFALYGDTTGETDEFGLPIRYPWAEDYRGSATVVYGHTPVPDAEWLNRTINIDTGCVFGGKLTALRWPERELVQVPAKRQYAVPGRPFLGSTTAASDQSSVTSDQSLKSLALLPSLTANPSTHQPALQWLHDETLRAEDVLGKRFVPTTLMGNVTVRAENAAAALEVMSRFAVEPRWLIYLPPTMSPSETTAEPGYLEYPREAFDYYRKNGVEQVVCQSKHMGSRAVLVVCRDEEAARRRFGAREGIGVCYTRTGRRFFDDDKLNRALLDEVSSAIGRAGLWEELETDWVCLDAELMPWNAKAQGLLREQYAPVGAAAKLSLDAAVSAAREAVGRGLDLGDLVAKLEQRRQDAERYVEAYGRYCWDTNGLQDLKLAPFHLMASEGRTWLDRDHAWHVETLGRLAAVSDLFMKTESQTVDLSDEASCDAAIGWWLEYTGEGGEGMVVKPLQFVVRGSKGLAQPAVKVRGRNYLRIIYGPEYTEPENLERLRKRGLHSKRALASREFALGVEALERFVRREPLRLVHECVFAVLALESEPVDPRL